MSSKVRVRFAPSPTGMVHIGNLRTAIFNWLYAKKMGGDFLLRIEDTDQERSTEESKQVIFDVLDWMQLKPDEKEILQSKNIESHKALVQKLLSEGKAYKCYCASRKNLDNQEFSKYSGACREADDRGEDYVVRFKLPNNLPENLLFDDLVHGQFSMPSNQLDDFILIRSDGSPTYNFAVVADDHAMSITHIIRGEDHVSNTFKQILLGKALGYQTPKFAHLPLILNQEGGKLSKRDGEVSALNYRQAGYLPEALLNYLVRLGWSHGDQEIFSRDELIKFFDLNKVQKSGAAFDKAKLDWLNQTYLRNKSSEEIFALIEKDLNSIFSKDQKLALIDLYKERSTTLKELALFIDIIAKSPKEYDSEALKSIQPESKRVVADAVKILSESIDWSSSALSDQIKDWAKKNGFKLGQIAPLIRLSVTGGTESPGIFSLIEILGKNETINRLNRFLAII